MRLAIACLLTALIALLFSPPQAFAQRNFDRRQQFNFLNQLQRREQARQQAEMRRIQRQFQEQQSLLAQEQQRQRELLQYTQTLGDPLLDPTMIPPRLTRPPSYFGNMHRGSHMFLRLTPYYNYAFIHRRNRSGGGTTTQPNQIPRGALFFGF